MAVPLSMFIFSLVGIIALLTFKAWEEGREPRERAPFRRKLDDTALILKAWLEQAEMIIAEFPSVARFLGLKLVALLAVHFAGLARAASDSAHRLADFVSHKHNFERRETRSDFLKQMSEHKNGNGKSGRKLL